MNRPLAHVRARLTYANTMSTLAVFIALGGGAYAAATLPRNSVGSAQLRNNAVGASELGAGAVRSSEIRDRSVGLRDLSTGARSALRGAQGSTGPAGPAGPASTTHRAAVNRGGGTPAGNARGASHQGGSNEYTVEFTADVSGCLYSATLAAVQNGPALEQPPAGRITVASVGGANVLVRTFAADGSPVEAPFHLIVAC